MDYAALMSAPGADLLSVDGLLAAVRPTWMFKAACRGRGNAEFFTAPGSHTDESWRAVCDGCEVQGDCLEYALADPSMMGNWAGTSERERRRMRRAA